MEVAIASPDEGAGEDFKNVLETKGVKATVFHRKVRPRVVGSESGENVINPDQENIARDLANIIEEAVREGHEITTISCNTLSIEHRFIDPVLKILEQRNLVRGRDFTLITTLEAIKNKYRDVSEMPVVLGTSVLARELPANEFKTLYSMKFPEIQGLVQEIIWRTKAVQGSDVSTAPSVYKGELASSDVLDQRVKLLVKSLKEAGINEVILGCTELPYAFKRFRDNNSNISIVTRDPAEFVAEEIKTLRANT